MSTMIKKAVTAATLAMALPAAMASDLYGGGATFPAVPYIGPALVGTTTRLAVSDAAIVPTPAPTFALASATSIFGAWAAATNNEISYCLTGSGKGKTTQIGGNASSQCTQGSSTPPGFSAAAGRTLPNFIGTDSPYSDNDHNSFLAGSGTAKSAVVQVPSVVGAITLPYRLDAIAGTQLDLPVDEVCKIFAGVYTTWGQVPGVPATVTTPITLVYRGDGSGTTFAYTNFLARNCNSANGGPIGDDAPNDAAFETNQTYSSAVNFGRYSGITTVSANGNPALVNAVNAGDGRIGYADPGDVLVAGNTWALVNSEDPAAFTSPAFSSVLVDEVIGATSKVTGLPTHIAPTVTPAVSGGILLIDPATVVSSGYPIFAPTYLNFYAAGNADTNVGGDLDAAVNLQDLLFFIYDPARRPALPDGFSYVDDTNIAGDVINATLLIN